MTAEYAVFGSVEGNTTTLLFGIHPVNNKPITTLAAAESLAVTARECGVRDDRVRAYGFTNELHGWQVAEETKHG